MIQFAVRSISQRELESTFSGPGGAGVVLLQFQFNQVMLRKPGRSEKHTLKNREVILQPQAGRQKGLAGRESLTPRIIEWLGLESSLKIRSFQPLPWVGMPPTRPGCSNATCAIPYAGRMGAGTGADQWVGPESAEPGTPWCPLPTLQLKGFEIVFRAFFFSPLGVYYLD